LRGRSEGRQRLNRAGHNSATERPSERALVSARIFVFLCLISLICGALKPARAQTTAEEYQIKAAFLYHFAQFVEWPVSALNAKDLSLNLCILDGDPHLLELRNAIEGKPIGARVFHVRQVSPAQEIQGCHMLFFSRDEARRQSAMLKSLRGLPVLTVGETANFLTEGGMIRFHLEDNKIRFDINLGAADLSHLKISSRLLLLATSVNRGNVTEAGR
jgi:hypothetical protein